MKNLPVQSLVFDDIKENLKQFLKGNPDYKDFNFEASGISTLLNVLSYNTHYIGFFVKMMLDEAFTDSAHTKQALLSHAKKHGYVPRAKKAAIAEVILTVNTDTTSEPSSRVIAIERGTTFTAVNSAEDQRTFTVLDGTTLTNRVVTGLDVAYTSGEISVYEGAIRTWNFIVDTSVVNQRFVIKDPNIDIDTARVRVKPDEFSLISDSYTNVLDILEVTNDSKVFYTTTDENGNYQFFFGNNIFGNQPDNGNIVEVTYITTSGPEGNGAKDFNFNAPAPGGAETNIGNFEDFEVETVNVSAGGLDPQTIDELKFAIPTHYRRQNRAFTASDFKSILMEEYRNIDSINVWGGEDHIYKDFGKVYISIKPKFSNRLTSQARETIKANLIKRYGVVGIDAVFVDPEFITVDVSIFAKLDKRKTNLTTQEVSNSILISAQTYNTEKLSRFDQILSDIEFLNFIRADKDFVSTIYTTKVIKKTKQHLNGSDSTNNVYFGNAIVPESIMSSNVTYGTLTVWIKDDGLGALSLYSSTGNLAIAAGTVDYITGQVNYKLPKAAKIAGYEGSTIGVIEFSSIPQIPDIQTSLNNIVQLGNIVVSTS